MNASPQPDVPILVETPSRPVIPMVRCHYMSIEYDDPSHVWNLDLNGSQMPFLMLNLVGIVQQPFGATRFNSYDLIDQLFLRLEQQLVSVAFEDLWLPTFLFRGEPEVGDVYRMGTNLFAAAFQFRDGRQTREAFEAICKDLHGEMVPSPEEAQAFRGWIGEQVSTARNRPAKNPELRLQTKKS